MLILSRKLNESIVIDGRIVVKILRIDRDTVKLGIQAPADLPVHRQEIYDAIQRGKQQSAQGVTSDMARKSTPPHAAPVGENSNGPVPPGNSNGDPGHK